MKSIIAAMCLAVLTTAAHAAIKTEPVTYKSGDVTLKGQLVYDDAATGKRPGVIVVHEWWGLNDYAKHRATMLAEAGYVALAVDMYGDGKTTEHPDEAGKWASAVRSGAKAGMDRFMAGYDLLKSNPHVDPAHISAIGYCFGGGVVLSAALSGVPLDAVVSFHGALPTDPATGKPTARVLVCHGAADPFTTPEQIATFQKNMTDAGMDWEFILYANAKHSFTNPDAGTHGMPQLEYNQKADKRSWQTMLNFLAESGK
ncbi:MAG TPA: dienelactone hydrolase family protein [Candidatus Krumholzibacteria bacterium]|nr:dienelactone hydrolase family protein [Candidatus Krumholzibacteria bacterium]